MYASVNAQTAAKQVLGVIGSGGPLTSVVQPLTAALQQAGIPVNFGRNPNQSIIQSKLAEIMSAHSDLPGADGVDANNPAEVAKFFANYTYNHEQGVQDAYNSAISLYQNNPTKDITTPVAQIVKRGNLATPTPKTTYPNWQPGMTSGTVVGPDNKIYDVLPNGRFWPHGKPRSQRP
jgi:hypothetical protein